MFIDDARVNHSHLQPYNPIIDPINESPHIFYNRIQLRLRCCSSAKLSQDSDVIYWEFRKVGSNNETNASGLEKNETLHLHSKS